MSAEARELEGVRMSYKTAGGHAPRRTLPAAAIFCLVLSVAAAAQQPAPGTKQPAQQKPPATQPAPAPAPKSGQSATHIAPDQAKQLFASVDQIMQFASTESGLPIKSPVKRTLTTRAAVENYLVDRFNNDTASKRMQRDEIVLKKFGLLDRDFALKPFLLALLREQIEAYYDAKTKTINLLDWVQPDEQKPVLAHELTHALQDQHSDLEKWDDQTPDEVSTNSAVDQAHLAKDEMDAARDAVSEGQATAVMMDYFLKPLGKSIVKDPEVIDIIRDHMAASPDSPVMSRAPLLISESMLFPYRDGLSFEQDVWMDNGRNAAFAGALDRPPTSTWEILNPRDYEQKLMPPVPLLPNIHSLVDKLYSPYDIGQVGQLDVKIMTQLFGGDRASRDLTPAWNGGLYWAGQLRDAAAADKATTKSLAIFYLSVWHNPASALAFAKLYANSLGNKYASVKSDAAAENSGSTEGGSMEQDFTTDEGPVVITTRGAMVFVAESFPLKLARQLTSMILDAQGGGDLQMTDAQPLIGSPVTPLLQPVLPVSAAKAGAPLSSSLSDSFVRFFARCGAMKTAVNAETASATLKGRGFSRAETPAK